MTSANVTPRHNPWWRLFWPHPLTVTPRERARIAVGAALGIALTALLSHLGATWLGMSGAWLIAPMGASAVLVFGVASSPMAQPWAVVVGHVVAVAAGSVCAALVPGAEWAGATAVALSIVAMFVLRCMHPPAGGTALLVALSGASQWHWALFPVTFNAVLLVGAGMGYHHLTGHAYPQQGSTPASEDDDDASLDADLDRVLARHNQVLDISRDVLKDLLHDTQLQAYQHKLDHVRCADIMSRNLITARMPMSSEQASELLREHHIKALPVVDRDGRLVGIVTQADIVRKASSRAATVADIMTRQVRVAHERRHLAELIALFGGTGHHHLPIVREDRILVGVITQSDVVSALCRPSAQLLNPPNTP